MEPLVSVCCITYNHENYIRDALSSFIMQQTNFDYEILIHDDASTDGTGEIIKEFELKYPDIIKPIYQKENQYSKNPRVPAKNVWPRAQGRYIATCEGDDFWLDKNKLQKQVDILENNPEFVYCFHSVQVVDTAKNPIGKFLGPHGKGSGSYFLSETGQGSFVHLSSIMMRTELVQEKLPDWYFDASHGDYALIFYLEGLGKNYYIDEVMSCYRIGVNGSLMTSFRKDESKTLKLQYYEHRINTINSADSYFNYRLFNEFKTLRLSNEVRINLLRNDFSRDAIKKYLAFASNNGWLKLLKIIISFKLPTLKKILVQR
ncbi:glycosyltransferase [Gracilibacillus saliphilus]|uniref:glycosyltransferase n=1 Tax=Gracilibacillus saliphilus TaxID=543890 RepID=UPI0013D785FA|nr:glycosyltransferase [Gracilibacillus saliphilus]